MIKEGWDMLLSGACTVPKIRDCLHEKGLRTRAGKTVSLNTMYLVFSNLFCTGYYEWKGSLKKGKHIPMISLDDFDRAQMILGRKGKPRNNKHEHRYTGIIRCAECGCMITAEPPKIRRNKTDGKIRVYHYMRCTKKNPDIKCSQKYIRVKDLEVQIDRLLETVEIPEAFIRWAFKELRKRNQKKNRNFAAQRAQIQKKYNENEAMLENLTDKLVRGIISEEIYKSTEKRYIGRREQLSEQLNRCGKRKDDWIDRLEKTFDFARTARKKFAEGDADTKRALFLKLGSNFLLRDKELTLELNKNFRHAEKVVTVTRRHISRLEPPKRGNTINQIPNPERLIPVWSSLLEDIRTFFMSQAAN